VAAGGHLVVTFLSWIADQFHRIRTGGYPGALRDLLGLWVEEFHPLPPGATVTLALSGPGSGLALGLGAAAGTRWSERLRPAGCEVVARYDAGVLAGLPAVTRNTHGGGVAWYLSTWLADDAYDSLLSEAADAAGVRPVLAGVPPGVAVSRRHGQDGASWLFAFNHTAEPVTLPAAGLDLLSGQAADPLRLPARGVAVLRENPVAPPV
jgi:beta-galactosidase